MQFFANLLSLILYHKGCMLFIQGFHIIPAAVCVIRHAQFLISKDAEVFEVEFGKHFEEGSIPCEVFGCTEMVF